MPTNRRRRTRPATPPLFEAVKYFLLTGDYCGRALFPTDPRGRVEAFRLASPSLRGELRGLWREHRAELLKEWKAEGCEGRPWAAKQLEKEEGR
jgi:hypothetical protein